MNIDRAESDFKLQFKEILKIDKKRNRFTNNLILMILIELKRISLVQERKSEVICLPLLSYFNSPHEL